MKCILVVDDKEMPFQSTEMMRKYARTHNYFLRFNVYRFRRPVFSAVPADNNGRHNRSNISFCAGG